MLAGKLSEQDEEDLEAELQQLQEEVGALFRRSVAIDPHPFSRSLIFVYPKSQPSNTTVASSR